MTGFEDDLGEISTVDVPGASAGTYYEPFMCRSSSSALMTSSSAGSMEQDSLSAAHDVGHVYRVRLH